MTMNQKNDDLFSLRKVDDFTIISLRKGAKKILTTVDSKENLISVLKTISGSGETKGVAILYSAKYPGNEDYKKFMFECIEEKPSADKSRYTTTYRYAIIQFLEIIREFPVPIVSGMNGEIGPDSLGLNLALDLRIASENTYFLNPNLDLGLPPSSLLSYFFVRAHGPARATEFLLTRNKFSAQEALDLCLVTEVVPEADIEKSCLEKLQALCRVPAQTILETRRMLQPSMDDVKGKIDSGVQGALRSLYKLKT